MTLQSRINHLDLRHQELEQAIYAERMRPSSDTAKISEMKKRKLQLKEEIESLRRQGGAA